MLNGLDLFSGIGGISIALNEWVRPVAYCEIDPYCQAVLLSRIQTGALYKAPIWDDITTLGVSSLPTGDRYKVDIIYGGFPCQDISVAGRGKGLEGERSGLFFEIVRLSKEIKPSFIFLENVPAICTRGGLQVVRTLAEMGYDCRWCVISAASVGALHRRERWFLLAHTQCFDGRTSSTRNGIQTAPEKLQFKNWEACSDDIKKICSGDLPNPSSSGCDKEQGRIASGLREKHPESADCGIENGGHALILSGEQTDPIPQSVESEGRTWGGSTGQHWPFESREHWQEAVSSVCRTTNGVPFLVDRLRGLGNSVVPIQAKEAFKILMGIK